MDQGAALKKAESLLPEATEAFDSEFVVASNDAVIADSTDTQIELLREKIKASRLEKLMARQLENELSITEISFESSLDLDDEDDAPDTAQLTADMLMNRREMRLRQRETIETARSRFQSSRSECESILGDLKEHTESLFRLGERSASFLDYMNRVESEFKDMDAMELDLRDKSKELDRAVSKISESQSLIEKQRRQIELLETMRHTANESYEEARRELDESQADNERVRAKLNEAIAATSRLEREKMAVGEKFETARMELEKANSGIKSLRSQNQEREQQVAQLTAELNEIASANDQSLHELANLQMKYNELNKKNLESQGQHYAKISQLEEAVRELKTLLDRRTREKNEIRVELEAANNLLVLHEEMISALSPQRRS